MKNKTEISVIHDAFKATVLDDINPSLYWDVDITTKVLPPIIPISYPESTYNKGIFLFKKENGSTTILTGHIPTLINQGFSIKEIKTEYNVIQVKKEIPFLKTLRDYQIESVRKIIKYKRGIISVPTGGGKTFIISEVINQLAPNNVNILILVPNISLLYQTCSSIKKYFHPQDISIGKIGDGHLELNNKITVGIFNTIFKKKDELKDYLENLNVLMVDEVHLMMNPSCLIIYSYLTKCSFKIGLSATPKYSTLMEGIFGPILHEETPKKLMEDNIIQCPEVLIYKVPEKTNINPKGNLWMNHKNITDKDGNFSHWKYNQLLEALVVNHNERNQLITEVVNKYYLEGRGPILVVVDRVGKTKSQSKDTQAEILLKLLEDKLEIKIPLLKGNNSSKTNEGILRRLRNGEEEVVIAGPKILQVGTDIPILNCLILANVGKQASSLVQQIGRGLRTHSNNTHRPLIINFFDTQFPFEKQSEKRVSVCKEVYGAENVTFMDKFI